MMSGRRDWLASELTPEVLQELKKKYGQMKMPSFGPVSMPPWVRVSWGDYIEALSNIGTNQGFAQAPGPSGEVLDFSQLIPGIGEVASTVRNARNIFETRPRGDIPEVQNLGIGFIVGAALAGAMNAWELGTGRAGISRRETTLKVFSRMASEFLSVAGPMPLLSGPGQRGLLAMGGVSKTDMARGTPGVDIPLGRRMASFALSLGVSTRQPLAQSVEREEITAGEAALRSLGIRPNIFTGLPAADKYERQQAIINRGVNALIRRQATNAYREFVDHGNFLPMDTIWDRRLNIDEDLRGFRTERKLAHVTRTEAGRSLRNMVKDDELRGRAVDRYEAVMLERGKELKHIAIVASALRTMHPSVFERMIDAQMRGENTQVGMLEFLWKATMSPDRPDWGRDHEGSWVRLWDTANLRNATFTGVSLRKWRDLAGTRTVPGWIERNRSATDALSEFLSPELIDAPGGLFLEKLRPRGGVEKPNIRKMLEVPK